MTEATPKRTTRKADPSTAVLAEVRAARKAIGARHMPIAGGERPDKGRAHHRHQATRWKAIEHSRSVAETPGWDSALLASAFGAVAESNPEHIRSGLVRLAALAVGAVESLDREAP